MPRWLFADQLGPHFLDDPDQPVLLIESEAVLRRRVYHRQKAHLILSALRHRAAELGDRAVLVRAGSYREALERAGAGRHPRPVEVCHPTSRAALRLVRGLPGVRILPARGFATGAADFAAWARGQPGEPARGGRSRAGPLRMDSFYRAARVARGVLMAGDRPEGGAWSYDTANREPPPRGATRLDVPAPPEIVEDDIDARVRHDLDRRERGGDVSFTGRDGPRLFPVTRAEALARLDHFIRYRLPGFGRYEDAMLAGDPYLAHSVLSASMNLGLLDPMEAVRRAEAAYRSGAAPLSSVEGYVRQLIGWRDYMWHLYWHLGPGFARRNALGARRRLPAWWRGLNPDPVRARCLSDVLAGVRDRGWVHHIPRLMVLGNFAAQRGYHPADLAGWFHRCFVDGYPWVMTGNVVGMSQYADGGTITTKPYVSGGAYLNRMSDYCGACRYRPARRRGDDACPFTTGYWAYLHRNRAALAGNARMARALRQLDRLPDRDEVVAQHARVRRAP